MKKLMALGLACLTCLAGCASTTKESKHPVGEVKAPETKDVKVGNWIYTVPYNFDMRASKSGLVSYWAPGNILMVAAMAEKFPGTLDEMTAHKLQLLTSDEMAMTVLGVHKTNVNGNDAVVLVAKNDTIYLIILLSLNDDSMLTLTCGGYMATHDQSVGTCTKIMSSVK